MHVMSVAELIQNLANEPDQTRDWWSLWSKAAGEVMGGVSIRMGIVVTAGRKRKE